jgi:DNA-binding transcriptional MerR regulator
MGAPDSNDRHAVMGYTFQAVSKSMSDSFVQIEIPDRSLFKASEVCDLVKLQPYVLRSWEAEFPGLGVAKAGGGPRVYRRTDVEQVVRIKHLLLVEGLTLAGARRKLDEEGAPVAADQPAIVELVGKNARERLTAVKRGLRSILDLIGPNGDTREFRLSPPAAEPRSRAKASARAKAPRRKAAPPASRRAAPKSRSRR